MAEVINIEQARKEIQKWVDSKRIKPKRLAGLAGTINSLAEAVATGDLVVHEDNVLEQKLSFPIGNGTITCLKWQPRLKISELQDRLRGIAPGDTIGMSVSVIAAATGIARDIVGQLDTEDWALSDQIGIFFTPMLMLT